MFSGNERPHLDIVFKLEKSFDITIPREELSPEDILTNSQYVQDGVVTEEVLGQVIEGRRQDLVLAVKQEVPLARNLDVRTVELDEFEKAEAGVSCLALVIPARAS